MKILALLLISPLVWVVYSNLNIFIASKIFTKEEMVEVAQTIIALSAFIVVAILGVIILLGWV